MELMCDEFLQILSEKRILSCQVTNLLSEVETLKQELQRCKEENNCTQLNPQTAKVCNGNRESDGGVLALNIIGSVLPNQQPYCTSSKSSSSPADQLGSKLADLAQLEVLNLQQPDSFFPGLLL
jgi:hypothetical protein